MRVKYPGVTRMCSRGDLMYDSVTLSLACQGIPDASGISSPAKSSSCKPVPKKGRRGYPRIVTFLFVVRLTKLTFF